MKQDALRYGYHIDIESGYRDYDYQEKIYNKLLINGAEKHERKLLFNNQC